MSADGSHQSARRPLSVFVVAVGTGEAVYEAALDVIRQLHAQVYGEDEIDGIQDPYRAVDQSDPLV